MTRQELREIAAAQLEKCGTCRRLVPFRGAPALTCGSMRYRVVPANIMLGWGVVTPGGLIAYDYQVFAQCRNLLTKPHAAADEYVAGGCVGYERAQQ